MRPRLLDAFCCEGGAGTGYALAGFDVVGVDIANHAALYPYEFHRGDALRFIAAHGHEFDAIHASPPCQAHTALRSRQADEDLDAMLMPMPRHPDLVDATRRALERTGRPWIIENVPNAPLVDPITLCGSQFGLGVRCIDGRRRYLKRHRLFESNVALDPPGPCRHVGQPVGVYGEGGRQTTGGRYKADTAEARIALGMPWASRKGLSQAIPPAYTRHLGTALLRAVRAVA